jgi:phenylalanyl-tRNA synthetase alpha chain
MISWTDTQLRRLQELDTSASDLNQSFENAAARENAFQDIEKKQAQELRQRIKAFRKINLRPGLCKLEAKLVDTLIKQGFVQVTTPIMMSKGLLQKMSIDGNHPLNSQIYWLDKNKCLRPMLAPHLYYVLVDLLRLWDKPVKIFEVGPCFRKESQGSQHSSEFTMLNLVEMGLPAEQRKMRIKELGTLISETSGLSEYRFEKVTSEIYGDRYCGRKGSGGGRFSRHGPASAGSSLENNGYLGRNRFRA